MGSHSTFLGKLSWYKRTNAHTRSAIVIQACKRIHTPKSHYARMPTNAGTHRVSQPSRYKPMNAISAHTLSSCKTGQHTHTHTRFAIHAYQCAHTLNSHDTESKQIQAHSQLSLFKATVGNSTHCDTHSALTILASLRMHTHAQQNKAYKFIHTLSSCNTRQIMHTHTLNSHNISKPTNAGTRYALAIFESLWIYTLAIQAHECTHTLWQHSQHKHASAHTRSALAILTSLQMQAHAQHLQY